MFRQLAIATAAVLVITGVSAAPSMASAPPPEPSDQLSVYTGSVDDAGLAALVDLGVDRHDVAAAPSENGGFDVQVILSGEQATSSSCRPPSRRSRSCR